MMEAAIILLFLGVILFIWLWKCLSNDRLPTARDYAEAARRVPTSIIARSKDRSPTRSNRSRSFIAVPHRGSGPPPLPFSFYNFRGIVSPNDVVRMKEGVTELDLHGLRVWQAIEVTQMFLKQSREYYRRVRVITGRGLHSFGGAPRIKPEVETLLRNTGYKFKEMYEGGCLEVKL